jgi:peptide/nickel transport system permease protein
MARFAIARLGGLAGILVVLVAVVFVIQSVVPSDPARMIAGRGATPAVVAQVRHQLGLDKPLPDRFVRYIDRLAHGDLGVSTSA